MLLLIRALRLRPGRAVRAGLNAKFSQYLWQSIFWSSRHHCCHLRYWLRCRIARYDLARRSMGKTTVSRCRRSFGKLSLHDGENLRLGLIPCSQICIGAALQSSAFSVAHIIVGRIVTGESCHISRSQSCRSADRSIVRAWKWHQHNNCSYLPGRDVQGVSARVCRDGHGRLCHLRHCAVKVRIPIAVD